MSTQMITSDLLEELSAEQQQLLAGGQGGGDDTETSVDEDGGDTQDAGFYTGRKRFLITKRSIVTIRRLPVSR
jgi:hypothetical protein